MNLLLKRASTANTLRTSPFSKQIDLVATCKKEKIYSGKHHVYVFKSEVSVLPNGLSIGFTTHYLGSISDVGIFHRKMWFQKSATKTSVDERSILDIGVHGAGYLHRLANNWR